jgi:sortase A
MKRRTSTAPEKRQHAGSRKLWLLLSLVLVGAGAYLLLVVFAPSYSAPSTPSEEWNEPVPRTVLQQDRLYIPRLSLNVLYKSGDQRVLRDALWHRYPERGTPEQGGNFILAGHRFEIGFTPGQTKQRSPLYHIGKIEVGDYIYADFKGKRYQYEVTRKYRVQPNQTEIEQGSETAKMTLYTCTLKGEADGREVLEAHLIGSNIDPDAELKLGDTSR